MMQLTINGQTKDIFVPVETHSNVSLQDLLTILNLNPETIAVEKNGQIIEKDRYQNETVTEGDTLELIRFMGGGKSGVGTDKVRTGFKPVPTPSLPDFHIYPVITPELCRNGDPLMVLRACVDAGVKIVQLRVKGGGGDGERRDRFETAPYTAPSTTTLAHEFRRITDDAGVTFIINDHVDIALEVNADGVHLGQDDLPCQTVREMAPQLIIGVSTHNLEEALQAERDGASYINIGPIFPTQTKTLGIQPLGLDKIREISAKINIPFTVMGGIHEDNIDQVIAAITLVYPQLELEYRQMARNRAVYEDCWQKIKKDIIRQAIKYRKNQHIYIHRFSSYFENKYRNE